MKSLDILNLIQNNDINPYDILNITKSNSTYDIIRKAYKKKALILHPDKTQGKTEYEFKILHVCYKYLITKLEKQLNEDKKKEYYFDILKNKKSFVNVNKRESNDQLKAATIENKDISINSNWMDKNFRNYVLIEDDQQDEEEFFAEQKKYKKYNSYQEVLKDNKIDNFLFKKNGKFCIKRFNALFELLKEQQDSSQMIIYDSKNIQPLNINGNNLSLGSIKCLEGIMTINDNKKTKKNLVIDNCYEYKQVSNIAQLKDLSKKLTKKKLKEIENKTKINKLSNSEVKKNINEYNKQHSNNMKNIITETEDELLYKKANEFVKYDNDTLNFTENNFNKLPLSIQNTILSSGLIEENDSSKSKVKHIKYLKNSSKK